MSKIVNLCLLLGIIGLFCSKVQAQTNVPATVYWQFNSGASGQLATYSSGTSDYFSLNWVTAGSNQNYAGKSINWGDTLTLFKPIISTTASDTTDANLISFNIRMVSGYKFTPTSISIDGGRYGTDGGAIKVAWKSSDGTITRLGSNIKPNRISTSSTAPVYQSHLTYDLSSLTIPTSEGDCGLYVYIYSLGNTKTIGLGNAFVTGNITGSLVVKEKDTLTIAASPTTGGSVACSPIGTVFDKGSSLTVTATRNFGYKFSHWTSTGQDTVSKSASYTFSIAANTKLYAVFKPINTYSLTYGVKGGANSYMVSVAPSGTTVNGKQMYEEGTNVALTASNNAIVSFTNWKTGETQNVLNVTMNQNFVDTAVYSAVDYIVGWDFYKSGGSSRAADFYSTSDNSSSQLVLRNASGSLNSWLDKSMEAASGYYGQGAAVNWKDSSGRYYYQVNFNAADFKDIKVSASMLYNYDAWSVQKCEFSTDGSKFFSLGKYTFAAVGNWYSGTFSLPDSVSHATKVYVRWIPDYSSQYLGTGSIDGTSISNIYVTALKSALKDTIAPLLNSSVPAAGTTNASASGKIVLTFSENVQLTSGTVVGTLNGISLTPTVFGKTITFTYSGLTYGTQYTFSLPANSVSDLSSNKYSSPVSIAFNTMTRPVPTKKIFDFVVAQDGSGNGKTIQSAFDAVPANNTTPYLIFVKNGTYSEYPTLASGKNYVHLIGQSRDSVIVTSWHHNGLTENGVSYGTFNSQAMDIQASDFYGENFTVANTSGVDAGQAVALKNYGNRSVMKNVKLTGYQDTHLTGGDRQWYKNCDIRGSVDFIFGGGDVLFDNCRLYCQDRSGGDVIVAPSTASTTKWGYVIKNCTIDGASGQNNNFGLGRPWLNAPRAVYINTVMNIQPTAGGWWEMSGTVPALFAEYNSMNASGQTLDLSNRKTSYTNGSGTLITGLQSVLTDAQAATYTLANVLSGSDNWDPTPLVETTDAPTNVKLIGNNLTWDNTNYSICYVILRNDSVIGFTTSASYTVPALANTNNVYKVRAVAESGALSLTARAVALPKGTTAITWAAPAAITYGTALSATQLNAVVTGSTGTVTYTPALGTVLNAGNNTLKVEVAEDATYASASKTVTIVVNKAVPTVTWAAPSAITYGTALSATQLNASVDGNGTATYTPASGTVLNAGTQTLKVDFAESTNYQAVSKTVSLTVDKADSKITWNAPANIKHGTSLSATQLNATVTGTSGAAVYNPTAGTVLPVGANMLTVTYAEDVNYKGATASVTINVDPNTGVASLTAEDISIYPNPASSVAYVKMPGKADKATLTLTSAQGKICLVKKINAEVSEVNINNLPAGVYLVQIKTGDTVITKRIIKY